MNAKAFCLLPSAEYIEDAFPAPAFVGKIEMKGTGIKKISDINGI